MNALLVLFAGNLSGEAVSPAAAPLINEKNSLILALQRAQSFPGVGKTVLLTGPEGDFSSVIPGICIEKRDSWTVKALLEAIAAHSAGFDLSYFAWADCPFLDPALAGRLAERHVRYAAEYSYADGWPYGLAPELLSPGTAAILAKILGDNDGGPMGRDALFSVIQKDINAFDIETEISPVDLRCHRLNLCADSQRNLLLLRRFIECTAGEIPDTATVERIVAEKPEILRTLPAFYPVQVYGGCPQSCVWCPWPQAAGGACGASGAVTERRDYMEAQKFESLLEKISAFSGDAVIDISLWGELSLHPQKMALIEMVLRRPELALVIETSGIGWKNSELEHSAQLAHTAASVRRKSTLPPLSWIVSLDTADPARYKEIRGAGCAEANDCAKTLLSLFPRDAYVQAVRTEGAENDIERFYRSWKEVAPVTANIIIQKYDDCCGMLPRRQASDLSPVVRQPCWHLMRDMPILLDGTVPLCRQQIAAAENKITTGNALSEPLDIIWERGRRFYIEQSGAAPKYDSLCAGCDEYYTYNF
ncbi:MAG: spiro-SPASM protein [Treponema sp.]|jgi:spiro-SPASM protein|nr:spiro-SPASM protein [Treponema sp.]